MTDDRPDIGSFDIDDPHDPREPVGEASTERPRRRPRWWSVGVGSATVLVVIWAFATAWVGIMGSSPAYLITCSSRSRWRVGLVAWALLVGPPPQRSRVRIWLARGGLLIAGVVLIGLLVYLRPLSAEQIALDALHDGGGVTVEVSRSTIRLIPDVDPRRVGLAFYPGAKVDPQAYAHVLRPIAEAGFEVVIFKQPYNLAILDSNAADAVIGDPGRRHRPVGRRRPLARRGDRLELRRKDRDELVGLLLYAAYPVNDMSDGGSRRHVGVRHRRRARHAGRHRGPDVRPPAGDGVRRDRRRHPLVLRRLRPAKRRRPAGTTRDDAQRQIADASIRFLQTFEPQ